MYKKILLAVDQSEYSKKAIKHAKELASNFKSEVILMHGYQMPNLTDYSIMYRIPDEDVKKMKENLSKSRCEFLDNIKKEFDSLNITISTKLVEKKPGLAIVKMAEDENCDIIILGSRGLGSVKSTLLGSVSNYVLHHSKIPVFVVC